MKTNQKLPLTEKEIKTKAYNDRMREKSVIALKREKALAEEKRLRTLKAKEAQEKELLQRQEKETISSKLDGMLQDRIT